MEERAVGDEEFGACFEGVEAGGAGPEGGGEVVSGHGVSGGGVLVDAWCRVRASAVAERDAPALEVAEELVPLGVGGGAVLFAGPGGPGR